MSEDLISVATAAVAAAKDAPPSVDAADAIADSGDVPGTHEGVPGGGDNPAANVAAVDAEDPAEDAPAEPDAVPDAEKPVDEDFAEEHGIRSKEPSGRENRIPYSRVKKITDNAVKKAVAPIEAERDSLRAQNTEYVDRLNRIQGVEDIMFNDQPRFIEILRTIPGYEELLGGGSAPASAAAPALKNGSIDWSQMPPPDADGNYSAEGFQKALEFAVMQGAAQAEARLAKRYEPIEKSFKDATKRREEQAQFKQRVSTTLADARKWRFFVENEPAILQAMQQDSEQAATSKQFKYPDIRAAYEDVVFNRLSTDRQRQREEILAELNKAPRSTAVPASRTAAKEPEETLGPGLTGLEAVARAAVRRHQGR